MPRKGSKKRQPKKQNKNKNRPRRKTTSTASRGMVQGSIPLSGATTIPRPSMSFRTVTGGVSDHIRTTGREVVTPIMAKTTFTNLVTEPFNPLNANLFPKLCAIATVFEKWRPVRFTVTYLPSCPATRSGQVSSWFDSDVADTPSYTNVTQVLNEQFSGASPGYQSFAYTYTFSEDDFRWYYTQSTGSNPADRTASCGKLYAFSSDAASADAGALLGYFVIDYDIEFCTYRTPITSGFAIVNNSPTLPASGVDTAMVLSDGANTYWQAAARAGRYLYSLLQPEKTDGTTYGNSYRAMLLPPKTLQTDGCVQLSLTSATGEPLRKARVLSEGFCPWRAVQNDDGSWCYQTGPDAPLLPYSDKKLDPLVPTAAGDYKVWITSTAPDGTETVLFTTGVNNNAAALLVDMVFSLVPSQVAWIRVMANIVFTTARQINYIKSIIGPSTSLNDNPPLSKTRFITPTFDEGKVHDTDDLGGLPVIVTKTGKKTS